jgi:hypothetical protein
MLAASGLGSFWSRRVIAGSDRKLQIALAIVAAAVALLAMIASPVTSALVGLPLALKVVIAASLIAPVAFVMGMPFPTGLARLESFHKPSVRWAWSLNAASSVMGSAGAIFLAIYIGLRATLLVGGVMYLLALLAVRLTRKVNRSISVAAL